MYRAFGLVTPQSDVTLESLLGKLRSEFPGYEVTITGPQIHIAKADWQFEILERLGPDVQTESIDLAEKLAGHEDAADLESCSRRLEIWSDTPDPELDHFEKFQRVVGVLKSIPGVIVIDPAEPSFL